MYEGGGGGFAGGGGGNDGLFLLPAVLLTTRLLFSWSSLSGDKSGNSKTEDDFD